MNKEISPIKKFIVLTVGKNGAFVDGVEYEEGKFYIPSEDSIKVEGDVINVEHSNHYVQNVIKPQVSVDKLNKNVQVYNIEPLNIDILSGDNILLEFVPDKGYLYNLLNLRVRSYDVSTKGATSGSVSFHFIVEDLMSNDDMTIFRFVGNYNQVIDFDYNSLITGSYYTNDKNNIIPQLFRNVYLRSGVNNLSTIIRNDTDITLNMQDILRDFKLLFLKEGVS